MKTNIVGFLYIAASAIFLFSFIVNIIMPLVFFGGQVEDFNQIWIGLLALFLGVYAFILGSAIRKHKKWSWYTGIITSVLSFLGNVVYIVMFSSLGTVLPLFFNAFTIYALIVEKTLFFYVANQSVQANQQPPIIQNSV